MSLLPVALWVSSAWVSRKVSFAWVLRKVSFAQECRYKSFPWVSLHVVASLFGGSHIIVLQSCCSRVAVVLQSCCMSFATKRRKTYGNDMQRHTLARLLQHDDT